MIFCGVFDGHGPMGHKISRHVCDSLPSRVHSRIKSSNISSQSRQEEGLFCELEEVLVTFFKRIDSELGLDSPYDSFCSGTTAVTVLKQGDCLVIANLGDSRAVLGTRGGKSSLKAVQLTVDLKPCVQREAERIVSCKGRVFAMEEEPDVHRVWMPDDDCPGLAMSRAFGDFCLKDYGLLCIPEVFCRKVSRDDEFVVLATDGIWDVLSNEEVVKIVGACKDRSIAAETLVQRAARSWRTKFPASKADDCAVVVLFLNHRPYPREGNVSRAVSTLSWRSGFPQMAQSRANFSSRNLTKTQLGGVVFGCTKDTIKECLSKHLFGLPYNHISYVQKIDTALPLFLFNYSDRKLHGIFEAAGPGLLNINPYAWTSNGSDRTSFPAQVQISARLQCEPLSEEQFKPAIEDNYYTCHHFWFELDHLQTNKLICLLTSFALKPKPPLSTCTPQNRQLFHFPSSPQIGDQVKPSKNEPVEVSLVSAKEFDSSLSEQMNKDCLLEEELRDLALSHDDNTLIKTVDQPNIPTCNNLKGDGGSLVSSPPQHTTIIQLMHEVKELRAYGIENSTKICYLEEKLGEAHIEIHRLRERCNMLESKSAGSLISKARGSDVGESHSPDDSTEAILLLGGFDGYSESGLSSVQSYFPSRNVIMAHSSMSCIRSNASVAKLDGKVYVFGGDEGGHGWSNTVESYNETDGRWSLCPPLNDRKGNLGGATLDGKIFAIGGGNAEVVFSDVEMLDPDIGRWIRTRSMEHKRFAVAASEHNGSIYAVGGFDGKEYLNTAERFDPREHSWMRIASMKSRRGCHSLVVLNEKLYAIGGYDGSTMVSSVEIYEPRRGTWIEGEAMKEARGYSAAAVVKDCIYVIGGYKGEGVDILDTVECFKDGKGWEKVPCSSMGRRGFLSAVAL